MNRLAPLLDIGKVVLGKIATTGNGDGFYVYIQRITSNLVAIKIVWQTLIGYEILRDKYYITLWNQNDLTPIGALIDGLIIASLKRIPEISSHEQKIWEIYNGSMPEN